MQAKPRRRRRRGTPRRASPIDLLNSKLALFQFPWGVTRIAPRLWLIERMPSSGPPTRIMVDEPTDHRAAYSVIAFIEGFEEAIARHAPAAAMEVIPRLYTHR